MNCEVLKTPIDRGRSRWSHTMNLLWRRMSLLARRPRKALHLCETLPLGERRFVAVIEFEGSRFLVGGTSTAIVLLAELGRRGVARPTEISARADEKEPL